MDVSQLFKQAVEQEASDIFLIPGMPFSYKIGGQIVYLGEDKIFPDEMDKIIAEIYKIANNRDITKVTKDGDDDFSFAIKGLSRFRASVMRQRGSLAAIIRIVRFELPDFTALNLPRNVIDISRMTKGLVLVTGPAGSGKSTTLACIINEINNTRNAHVITLEDPIEYLHRHNKSVVTQREVGNDTESYMSGLRAALRQAPDVILLGEMRDFETIRTAMTAAETGHLVISTLHTIGAANTIDRIIDSFPPNQQAQIRIQLSMVLQAVVSQQLVPDTEEKLVPAFEIMTVNPAIRNMIRDNKVPQIDGILYSSSKPEMISMDSSLLRLYREKRITAQTAAAYATNPDMLSKKL